MPYTLNGQSLGLNNEPQLKDGTMWVPLRDVAEAMGAKVDFDPDNGVAIVYQGDHMVTIKVGDANVDVDGQNAHFAGSALCRSGRNLGAGALFQSSAQYGPQRRSGQQRRRSHQRCLKSTTS